MRWCRCLHVGSDLWLCDHHRGARRRVCGPGLLPTDVRLNQVTAFSAAPYWSLWTTSSLGHKPLHNHYTSLHTTTHHYTPLHTTTHHYTPLHTTTHHYTPLHTTTHHSGRTQPLHTTTHHSGRTQPQTHH